MQPGRKMTLEQVSSGSRSKVASTSGEKPVPPTRNAFADVASGVEQVGAVGQLPQAIADETAVGVRDPRAAAPRPVDAQKRLQGGFGHVEPDLGLAVVLKAGEGVEQQEGLVRRPLPATSELTDAVEPGEQGLAAEWSRAR